MPAISVIVPVYNVEPYLHRCVDSILNQTFTDFELILVDDGSPDNCPAICDEYAAKDSRVRVIHQPNGGLSAARNAGIDWTFSDSDSQWLSFVDSDDWIHPQYLEALYRGAEATGLSVIVGGFGRTEGENPDVDTAQLQAAQWSAEDYFCEKNVNAIIAVGKLYRKACFNAIRYPLGKIHEDEFTTYKILFACEKIAVIDQPLYAYYQNPNGIMGTEWTPARLVVLDAFKERTDFFKENGFDRIFRWSWIQYSTFFNHYLEIIKNNPAYHAAYYAEYSNRWQSEIRRFKKEAKISILKHPNVYRSLYPTLSALIIKGRKLGHKLKVFLHLREQ